MGRLEGVGDECQVTEAEDSHDLYHPEPRTDGQRPVVWTDSSPHGLHRCGS
jgi:hypothetical protein